MIKVEVRGQVEDYQVTEAKTGYRHCLTIKGTGYSAFIDDDIKRCNVSDHVSFRAEQNGQYWNIKSGLKIEKRGNGTVKKTVNPRDLGIQIGHGLNNAVALEVAYISAGDELNKDRIEANARMIYELSLKMQNDILNEE